MQNTIKTPKGTLIAKKLHIRKYHVILHPLNNQ
jgi:hypothetical protein